MKARHTILYVAIALSAQSVASQSVSESDSLQIIGQQTDLSAETDASGSALIGYQGLLSQNSEPVDGTVSITFAMYDVSAGGTPLWSEEKNVDVVAGVFETNLGDVTPITLPFDVVYWLGVTVATDAEMSPRTMLTATPYAFTAGGLQGRPVADVAPNSGDVLNWNGAAWAPGAPSGGSPWSPQGNDISFVTGEVGIGTESPDAKVEVASNSSLSEPQLLLHENGNDYARLNFENNNGSNYWTIAAYNATTTQNDRLNIWNGASGDLVTITGIGRVGFGVGISPKTDFHIGDGRSVLFGTDTLGSGDKLMFLPRLHAFRVGSIASGAASTYWNADSIGLYSFASGLNTRAQGFGSTAMGRDTEASNSYAFATGYFTNADGQYSTAMGFNTDALALGSTALGYSADAEENYSFAAGYFAEAQAIYSVAIGTGVQAQSYASMAVGRYNVGGGSATTWSVNDPIFEVGVGTSSTNRANAITVRKNGFVGIGTTVPLDALQVNGRVRFQSVEYLEDGGTNEIAARGDIRPSSDNVYDLGTSAFRWDDVFATNGVINTSDGRLKKNVEPITSVLDKVMDLRPVDFEWIDGRSGQTQSGLIAQEVLQIFPDVVNTTDEVVDEVTGDVREIPAQWLGINYSRLIPKLISALQEQQAMIAQLQQRLDAMEANR